MTPKLKLPAASKTYGWPEKIETDQIIKAEAHCTICTVFLEDNTAAVVKMYYRRGFLNFLRGTLLNFRAQREYRILKNLASCRIPCSLPLFWTRGYCRQYGFYELICTRRILDAVSLRTFLSSGSLKGQSVDFGPLFQSLCNMHRCGIYHGALSTKNILVVATGRTCPECFLIDLARGWLFPRSIFGSRIASFDLAKLVRNIESHLGRGYCRPFLVQYGLGKEAIETLYRNTYRYKSYSRKHKRLKNYLKVKVFCFAVLTQLSQRLK